MLPEGYGSVRTRRTEGSALLRQRAHEREHGGDLAHGQVDPVDGRDRRRPRVASAGRPRRRSRRIGCRRPPRPRAPATASPASSPPRMSSSTSSPSTTSTSGARPGSSSGETTSSAPARLCRMEVGSCPAPGTGLLVGGDGGTEQLPHAFVRRRVLVGGTGAELGHQLAAQGVDQRLLAGVDETGLERRTSPSTVPAACSTWPTRPSMTRWSAPGRLTRATDRPASCSSYSWGAVAVAKASPNAEACRPAWPSAGPRSRSGRHGRPRTADHRRGPPRRPGRGRPRRA